MAAEIAPFGIRTTIVNPGFFRTELLTERLTNYANNPIQDYDEHRAHQMQFWKGANGQQSGNPAKLGQALISITNEENPPQRFLAGADAVVTAEQVVATLHDQTNAYRSLSTALSFDDS